MRRAFITAVILLFAGSGWAGWWEVHRHDQNFDLETARAQALAAVAEDPTSADAVAAALWWLDNLAYLPDPGEILVLDDAPRDPELGFLLTRIEAEILGRAPEGALRPAELSGPFGVFDTLDMERDVVPSDRDLPPVGTPWTVAWQPFRVVMNTADGTVRPPESMDVGGVTLAAWTLELSESLVGWLALEGNGSFNIHLDGRVLAELRFCGELDPEVTWYRIRLEPGRHRLRVAMGSVNNPRARFSLFDDDGMPVDVAVVPGGDAPRAASEATAGLPPAAADLDRRLDGGAATVSDLLMAAELAAGRGDVQRQWRRLDQARDLAPDDPWPRLALAWHYLMATTGADPQVNYRLARDELRLAGEIPAVKLAERVLAMREQRAEDMERVLNEAVEVAGEDPRVQQLWVQEAVRRGWAGEVESGIEGLTSRLPESTTVVDLKLTALESLERWQERRELLRSVAGTDPVRLRWIEDLATGCLVEDAVSALDRLDERVHDPALDEAMIRLLIGSEDEDRARSAIARARQSWGDLYTIDQMELVLEAADPEALDATLTAALERDPSEIQLRTLAWRRGLEPFFETFRLDADEVRRSQFDAGENADVVLLLDQAVERVFDDGSALYYYHGISRAVTPVGARQASLLQQMPDAHLFKVRIIKPDGRVVVPATMEARNGGLKLGDVAPGDLVEEEYVARVRPTGASRRGHMSPYIYRFAGEDRAFGLSEYLLLVPPDIDLKVDGNLEGLEREEFEYRGLRAIRWRNENVPPLRREPFAPPARDLLPWVSYSFGVSWQDVGDTIRDRVLAVLKPSPDIEAWSRPLLEPADDDAAVAALVDGVLEEVSPGRRELDFSTTAGRSFSRREGNRLGIVANALLAHGWDVDLVMARVRPLAGVHLEVPTLETFIEPLLRVSRDGPEIWLDFEQQRLGVNHIQPILQGGDGLVLPLSRPEVAVTLMEELPTFTNREFEQQVTLHATVQASGDARIRFEMPVRGSDGELLVRRVQSVSADRAQQVFLQMANNVFPGATAVSGEVQRSGLEHVVRIELTLPGACELSGDRMVCRNLVVSRPLVPTLAPLPERQFPLALELPITERVETVIQPPTGWSIDRPPRRLHAIWGTIDEELSSGVDGYRSVLKLVVPARVISPEEYPEFARFCQAADELASRPPALTRR
jgi:hypothetical protein